MAIGAKSDPNLENLAKWSNGQTYFIHDGKYVQHIYLCRDGKRQMLGSDFRDFRDRDEVEIIT